MIIVFILISLLFSAFFSGIEIAYISADRLQVELKRKKGSRRGHLAAAFLENPSSFIGTTLVGNNIAIVVFTSLMEEILAPQVSDYLPNLLQGEFASLLVITLITTVIILFFAEFLPKALFRINPSGILMTFTYPLQVIRWILSPFAWVMVKLSYAILYLVFKIRPEANQAVFTRMDLEHFIQNISPEEEQRINPTFFQNALKINDIRVRECIVPRNEIEAFEINAPVQELRALFVKTGFSRIPIYEDNIDEIKGYVHHQQMLNKATNIREILLPIPLVPEVKSARELMNRFIADKVSIAWVVDEFGGTAGIVTLEDILEEIFGEIEDEHDQNPHEVQLSDKEFVFSGRLEVNYLNEKYELNLPEGDYHTLSGMIVTEKAAIPKQGDQFSLHGFLFSLEQVSDTKIELVRLIKIYDEEMQDL